MHIAIAHFLAAQNSTYEEQQDNKQAEAPPLMWELQVAVVHRSSCDAYWRDALKPPSGTWVSKRKTDTRECRRVAALGHKNVAGHECALRWVRLRGNRSGGLLGRTRPRGLVAPHFHRTPLKNTANAFE